MAYRKYVFIFDNIDEILTSNCFGVIKVTQVLSVKPTSHRLVEFTKFVEFTKMAMSKMAMSDQVKKKMCCRLVSISFFSKKNNLKVVIIWLNVGFFLRFDSDSLIILTGLNIYQFFDARF